MIRFIQCVIFYTTCALGFGSILCVLNHSEFAIPLVMHAGFGILPWAFIAMKSGVAFPIPSVRYVEYEIDKIIKGSRS